MRINKSIQQFYKSCRHWHAGSLMSWNSIAGQMLAFTHLTEWSLCCTNHQACTLLRTCNDGFQISNIHETVAFFTNENQQFNELGRFYQINWNALLLVFQNHVKQPLLSLTTSRDKNLGPCLLHKAHWSTSTRTGHNLGK